MAAEIETLAYAKLTGIPWHGLGEPMEEGLSTAEVIARSGLGWTVHVEELTTSAGYAVPENRAVVRDGDFPIGAQRVLGVVGNEYYPVNNIEGFSFLEGLVEDGTLAWESAMSLRGGKVVCMVARMAEDWTIGDGDIHKTYIAVTMGHDGGLSIAAMPTDVRIICMNTHRMAFGAKAKKAMVKVRHTRNVAANMAEAQKLMRVTTESQRQYRVWLEALHGTPIENAGMNALLLEMFGDPSKAETTRVANNIQESLNMFRAKFLATEVGRQGATGYSLLQALTGYADHAFRFNGEGQKKLETRFSSSMIGGRGIIFKDAAAIKVGELTGIKL